MNYFCSWISDFLEMNYFLGAGDLLLDISILGDGLYFLDIFLAIYSNNEIPSNLELLLNLRS